MIPPAQHWLKTRCFLIVMLLHVVVIGYLLVRNQPQSPPILDTHKPLMLDLADFQEPQLSKPAFKSKSRSAPPQPEAIPLPQSSEPQTITTTGPSQNSVAAPANSSPPPNTTDDPASILATTIRTRIQSALVYPESAKRRGISGIVRLEIVLSPEGKPLAVTVKISSGSAILDKAALKLAASVLPVSMPHGLNSITTVQINVNYTPPL